MSQLLPSPRLVIGTAIVATIASVGIAASTPATMSVDGQRIVSDVSPVTTVGQAFLPIRAIAEATGGTTSYDESSGTITVRRGRDLLALKLGDRIAKLDGKRLLLAHAPFIVRGRTMVPSAAIAEAFASNVRYDTRTAKVDVRTPGVVVAPFPDDAP